MELELVGLPESLGTTKCYKCAVKPEFNKFDEMFVEYYGEVVSVPVCPKCVIKVIQEIYPSELESKLRQRSINENKS